MTDEGMGVFDIKALRKKLNLTQKELSIMSGVHLQTIKNIEASKYGKLSTRKKILDAINDYLFNDNKEEK